MEEMACAHARDTLAAAFRVPVTVLPSAALAAHIAGCDACRGLLLLTSAALIGEPIGTGEIACDTCRARLPELIEAEADGDRQRLRRLQPVWCHLWTCPACAEIHDMTQSMVAEEQTGRLRPPQIKRRAARPAASTLLLTRAFLNLALPPSAVYRGDSEQSHLLVDELTDSGAQMTVTVQERSGGAWRVVVTVAPPGVGWLQLSLGAAHFRAPFAASGVVGDRGCACDVADRCCRRRPARHHRASRTATRHRRNRPKGADA